MNTVNGNENSINSKKYKILFNNFASFLIISFFMSLSNNICAADLLREKAEELYQKGLMHRNNNQLEEAIECFQPLAEKNDCKAAHNLAMCFFKLGNELTAYHWFSVAKEKGLQASASNLKKMNLIYLLLPDEALIHIVSFFNMTELTRFNCVSRRANQAVNSFVTSIDNLLTSPSPYATHLRPLFKDVQFDLQPTALRLVQKARVNKGSIEVHFRDPKHLRKIVEAIPLIEVGDRLYFVRDNNAQDGKELITTEENMRQSYALLFSADSPLRVSGKTKARVPYPIVLPQGSDFKELSINIKGGISSQKLKAYTEAHALASAIENFDNQLFKMKTAEVYQLLEDRKKSRIQSPNLYPDLFSLCPDACLITGPNLEIVQKDYITAEQPLIYLSESIEGTRELHNKLPELSAISYIDPELRESGVYCASPLVLEKGFEIFSDTHLTIAGSIILDDYTLIIRSNGNDPLWLMGGVQIKGINIVIKKWRGLTMPRYYTRRHANIKPEDMPEEHWQQFLDFMCRTGRMQ